MLISMGRQSKGHLVERISARKAFSNILAGSVADSNNLFYFILCSADVLFLLKKILMLLLSYLSGIFSSFHAHVNVTKRYLCNQ